MIHVTIKYLGRGQVVLLFFLIVLILLAAPFFTVIFSLAALLLLSVYAESFIFICLVTWAIG